jgi:hypothetical protein
MTKRTPKVKNQREKSAQLLAERAQREVEALSPMSQMEKAAEESARKLGQERMDSQIAALSKEDGGPRPCPKCGKPVPVRAKAVARTFHSQWGTHTLIRNYHFCGECNRGFCPRDIELGLPEEGELTAALDAQVMDFALNSSFGKAEDRWEFHFPWLPLSSNQFRRSTKRLGNMVQESHPVLLQEAAKPQPPKAAKTLYIMLDGSHIPCQGEWKEGKLGLFFREEEYVPGSPVIRGKILEPRYAGCVGPQEEFIPLMKSAFQVEAAVRPKRVVALGDGAPGNWTVIRAVYPRAIEILDWYHALEHAIDLGKVFLGEASPMLVVWETRMKQLLWEGDVEAMLREATACLTEECLDHAPSPAQLKALESFAGYCRENAKRMQYRKFFEQKLLIGSGPIESAHKHVYQQRMKMSGQQWSPQGARRMASLRVLYSTAGPKRFYAAARWAHRESERLPARTQSRKRQASNR